MSTSLLVGIIALAGFLVLVFAGVPVTVSMAISGVGGCLFLLRTPTAAFDTLKASVFSGFTSYTTSVAPMFILMGLLAMETGIGDDLYDCFQTLTRHQNAGLAKSTAIVCAIFGAICGSSAATCSLMCSVAHPQMKRYNYSVELATGTIASCCCLSVLIPPSLHLITYGIAAEASVGKLLMAGITTGIFLMILFLITIEIMCKINPMHAPGREEKATAKEKWRAIRHGGFIEVILVFVLSFGGMFAGWFTPTEAGCVGFVGMMIVAIIFKRFKWSALFKAMKDTLTMSGMIYCMIAAAKCMGNMFTYSRIPNAISELITNLDIHRVWVIVILTLIYFVLGCMIDGIAIILITTPIFLPVIKALGYSDIWFGAYMVVIVGLGAVTPPVGTACYLTAGCTGESLTRVFKGCAPIFVAYVVCAIFLGIFPQIATILPDLLM